MREFVFIERLRERLTATRRDTRLTIGDDAALIAPPAGCELAVTTDTLIAGRHFPNDTSAFDIGYKALAVNLSDLAAMAAEPAWATIALTAPELRADWCDGLLDGARAAIETATVDIIGGDTTRGALSITVTAIGTLPTGTAVCRHGARAGDIVAVTGTLGDAALGLELWPERHALADDGDAQWLIGRLARPQWRAGMRMRGLASAAIDISDGLIADLGHILAASDVGARIDADALPASTALASRLEDRPDRRRYQLAGGDDYELCLTVAPDNFELLAAALADHGGLTAIGIVEPDAGLRLVDATGAAIESRVSGWDHFA